MKKIGELSRYIAIAFYQNHLKRISKGSFNGRRNPSDVTKEIHDRNPQVGEVTKI